MPRFPDASLTKPVTDRMPCGDLRGSPLAIADGSTVAPDDLVASDLIYPNRLGETYSVKYNPNHRWFYFPEMTADEALLLIDPTTPADAALRESSKYARWCSTSGNNV